MTLYTSKLCPKCDLVKRMLSEKNIHCEIVEDEQKAISLGFHSLPSMTDGDCKYDGLKLVREHILEVSK